MVRWPVSVPSGHHLGAATMRAPPLHAVCPFTHPPRARRRSNLIISHWRHARAHARTYTHAHTRAHAHCACAALLVVWWWRLVVQDLVLPLPEYLAGLLKILNDPDKASATHCERTAACSPLFPASTPRPWRSTPRRLPSTPLVTVPSRGRGRGRGRMLLLLLLMVVVVVAAAAAAVCWRRRDGDAAAAARPCVPCPLPFSLCMGPTSGHQPVVRGHPRRVPGPDQGEQQGGQQGGQADRGERRVPHGDPDPCLHHRRPRAQAGPWPSPQL